MAETSLPTISVTPPVRAVESKHSAAEAPLITTEGLSLFYGPSQAIKNISFAIREKLVTAFIGPSGCGKSTLLRCFNRMNDLIDGVRIDGAIKIGGHEIYDPEVDVI